MNKKIIGKISLKPRNLDIQLNKKYGCTWSDDDEDDEADWEDEVYND